MTKPSPEIEAKARARLAADEERFAQEGSSATATRITGSRRTSQTLGEAWRGVLAAPLPLADRRLPARRRRLPRDPATVLAGPS